MDLVRLSAMLNPVRKNGIFDAKLFCEPIKVMQNTVSHDTHKKCLYSSLKYTAIKKQKFGISIGTNSHGKLATC